MANVGPMNRASIAVVMVPAILRSFQASHSQRTESMPKQLFGPCRCYCGQAAEGPRFHHNSKTSPPIFHVPWRGAQPPSAPCRSRRLARRRFVLRNDFKARCRSLPWLIFLNSRTRCRSYGTNRSRMARVRLSAVPNHFTNSAQQACCGLDTRALLRSLRPKR